MNPYYRDSAVTIYHADCRDVLPNLPQVDLVLTDPPYGIGYVQRPTLYQRKASFKPQIWDDSRPTEIVLQLVPLAPKVVIWGGNFFPLPISRGWLCWQKPNTANTFGQFELAWTNLQMPPKLFQYPMGSTFNGHPTIKPLPLIKWTFSAIGFTDGWVIDPFMGSGTTLRAAKDLGMQAIGIEIEERYCEIAAKRMAQEVLPFELKSNGHAEAVRLI
jgi:site-specific DNA-methyltransferase (adenine-specific)